MIILYKERLIVYLFVFFLYRVNINKVCLCRKNKFKNKSAIEYGGIMKKKKGKEGFLFDYVNRANIVNICKDELSIENFIREKVVGCVFG